MNSAELYSLILVVMTLTFTQDYRVGRKSELLSSFFRNFFNQFRYGLYVVETFGFVEIKVIQIVKIILRWEKNYFAHCSDLVITD